MTFWSEICHHCGLIELLDLHWLNTLKKTLLTYFTPLSKCEKSELIYKFLGDCRDHKL